MSKTVREVIMGVGYDDLIGDSGNEGLADALIAAIDAAGFVIVPKEPTEAMLIAGAASCIFGDNDKMRLSDSEFERFRPAPEWRSFQRRWARPAIIHSDRAADAVRPAKLTPQSDLPGEP